MAYEQSDHLVLQFLLDDLNNLENQQKGKQRAGKLSDIEVAIKCMRDEIQGAQSSIQDGKLALSTVTAVVADQNVLASIRHDETMAEQDRRYALALSNGEMMPHDTPALGETESTEEEGDTVSAIMSDLMSRVRIYDDQTNEPCSAPSMLTSPTSSIAKECVSCLEKFNTTMFRGSCGHEYCRDCMKTMFIGAIKDEELYPPRCCGDSMPPDLALRILNYEELRSFCERAIEWTSKTRLYCAEPTCSKFIPPFAIHDEIGTCPSCDQKTHVACRSFAHPGVDCPMDDALHNVLEMAENESWKRCFHCRTMVELQHGCNHITCR